MKLLAALIAVACLSGGSSAVADSVCNGTQFVVATPDGHAHLRFEAQSYGSYPVYGPPSVTFEACCSTYRVITIRQTVSDIGSAPPQPLCHAEEVDLGPLADGAYSINYLPAPEVPSATPTLTQFWWGKGGIQCANAASFVVHGSLQANEPVDLTRTQQGYFLTGVSTFTTNVQGSVIAVDEIALVDELPVNGLPPCSSSSVTIPAVPAGEYTVNWTTHIRPGIWNEFHSFGLTISNPPGAMRRRAARH